MFVKAIRFEDARIGDVVSVYEGALPLRVDDILRPDDGRHPPGIVLVQWKRGAAVLTGRPDQIIGLVHRPLPEGKTLFSILLEIARLGEKLVRPTQLKSGAEMEETIAQLRRAIEDYELGKPPEPGFPPKWMSRE